jgi:hypothetical protein
MEATETGSDGASFAGTVGVEGALAVSETGVDLMLATYNPNALFRTVDVSAGNRSQGVQ